MREREQKKNSGSSMRDKARQEAEKRGQKSGNWSCIQLPEKIDFFKVEFPSGRDQITKKLDILPYHLISDGYKDMKKGDLWYERTYYIHANVGVDNKSRLCPSTFSKPCPICEKRQQMLDQGTPYNDQAVKALKKKERQLFNVIDVDSDDKAVKIFDVSYHLFGVQLEEELRSQDSDFAGFAELKDGYTLSIRFGQKSIPDATGKAGKPFTEAKRIDFKERKDYKDSILDDVIDLESCLIITSYEKLKAEFLEEDLEEDSPEKEVKSKGRQRKGEVEEDEVEEVKSKSRQHKDEVEEDEVEEVKSKGRQRKDEVEEVKSKGRQRKDVEEDEVEEVKSKSRQHKCPDKKGEFGVDNDSLDSCQECAEDIYNACVDEYDRLKKEKKKR